VTVAFRNCLPDHDILNSSLDAVSRYFVREKFWCVACSTVEREPSAGREPG
jgi:hypothetical protein